MQQQVAIKRLHLSPYDEENAAQYLLMKASNCADGPARCQSERTELVLLKVSTRTRGAGQQVSGPPGFHLRRQRISQNFHLVSIDSARSFVQTTICQSECFNASFQCFHALK